MIRQANEGFKENLRSSQQAALPQQRLEKRPNVIQATGRHVHTSPKVQLAPHGLITMCLGQPQTIGAQLILVSVRRHECEECLPIVFAVTVALGHGRV